MSHARSAVAYFHTSVWLGVREGGRGALGIGWGPDDWGKSWATFGELHTETTDYSIFVHKIIDGYVLEIIFMLF